MKKVCRILTGFPRFEGPAVVDFGQPAAAELPQWELTPFEWVNLNDLLRKEQDRMETLGEG